MARVSGIPADETACRAGSCLGSCTCLLIRGRRACHIKMAPPHVPRTAGMPGRGPAGTEGARPGRGTDPMRGEGGSPFAIPFPFVPLPSLFLIFSLAFLLLPWAFLHFCLSRRTRNVPCKAVLFSLLTGLFHAAQRMAGRGRLSFLLISSLKESATGRGRTGCGPVRMEG